MRELTLSSQGTCPRALNEGQSRGTWQPTMVHGCSVRKVKLRECLLFMDFLSNAVMFLSQLHNPTF